MRRQYRSRIKTGHGHFLSLMAHASCSDSPQAVRRVDGYRAAFDLGNYSTVLVNGPIKKPLCCAGCGERFRGGEVVVGWCGFSRRD